MCRGEFPPSAVLKTTNSAHNFGILKVVSEQTAALQKFQTLLKQLQSASSRIAELERQCKESCTSGQPTHTASPEVKADISVLHEENQELRKLLEISISTEEKYTKELEVLRSQFSSPAVSSLKRKSNELRTPRKFPKIQLPRALGS